MSDHHLFRDVTKVGVLEARHAELGDRVTAGGTGRDADEEAWFVRQLSGVAEQEEVLERDIDDLITIFDNARAIYSDKVYKVRNKTVAHPEVWGIDEVDDLYRKIKIGDVENILEMLDIIHSNLRAFFDNGHEPCLTSAHLKNEFDIEADVKSFYETIKVM